MRKELPVIPVNKVVDPKKMEGRGGGEAQGVADPKKRQQGGKGLEEGKTKS
jgi:hypothetical protein